MLQSQKTEFNLQQMLEKHIADETAKCLPDKRVAAFSFLQVNCQLAMAVCCTTKQITSYQYLRFHICCKKHRFKENTHL